MTRVLVLTEPEDLHALVVRKALAAKGHEAVLWYGPDFPGRQKASIAFEPEEGWRWEVKGRDLLMENPSFDTVWFRRPVHPVMPDSLHPADRVVAGREAAAFVQALWRWPGEEPFWVNPIGSYTRANSKPLQLRAATSAGLAVPPTLFSNDPREVKAFLRRHDNQAIYKSFVPAQWETGEGIDVLFTADVALDDLPDSRTLQLAPGIYQRRVEKAFELRATFFGDQVVCARILSQENQVTAGDWRAGFDNLPLEPWTLPEQVARGCRQVLRALGIVFGCVDLVVTPAGEHVFLEVNEMGQFLWLEGIEPELTMLDPFCELLIQRRVDLNWDPEAVELRFADFRQEAERELREEITPRHVAKPNNQTVDERPGEGGSAASAGSGHR